MFAAVAPLAQTRIAVLSEIVRLRRLPVPRRAGQRRGVLGQGDEGRRRRASWTPPIAAFGALDDWSAEPLKAALEAVGAERGLKLGKTQAPVRVAVTGRTVGLPLFESLEVLGPRADAGPAGRRRPAPA